MIGSVFFIFNRLVEIIFLIPIIGMLVCQSHPLSALSPGHNNTRPHRNKHP